MSDKKFLVVCLFLLFAACSRDFEEPLGPGSVTGKLELAKQPPIPAQQARVRLLECGLSVFSDALGGFRFLEVPAGSFTLQVEYTQPDLESQTLYSIRPGDPVVVQPAAVTHLGTVSVTAAGWIAGEVELADETSPLHTVVYLVEGSRLTHAADDGTFVLSGVPAGTWQVGAALPGYLSVEPVQVEIAVGQTSQVKLMMKKISPDVFGSVVGRVWLGNPGPRRGVSVELVERFLSIRYATITDHRGDFRLADLPVGYYEFLASDPGYRSVGIPNVEIRQDRSLDLPALILVPADSGHPQHPADEDPSGNLDDDGDSVPDKNDNCPVIPNPDQVDSNQDGIGDACDGLSPTYDSDGDSVPDAQDNCPFVFNPSQANHDSDPLGDACDEDDDNDGILDEFDHCPLIADPTNPPELCQWSLIVSERVHNGEIHLKRYEMTPEGVLIFPLTQDLGLSGESWGAQVSKEGWVYFHHRPKTIDSVFRICRFMLASPQNSLDCFEEDLSADSMHPHLCRTLEGANTPPVLLYEQHEPGLGWRIYAAELGRFPQRGQSLMLEALFPLPPRIEGSHNFLDPYCTGLGVSFSIDFRPDSDPFNPVDPGLEWEVWFSVLNRDGLTPTGEKYPLVSNPLQQQWTPGHQRRPVFAGIHHDNLVWYLDQEFGSRIDIMELHQGEPLMEPLIADGAFNTNPEYFPKGAGLLAFESNRGGNNNVYVMTLGSKTVVKVTQGSAWSGSPAWVW